MTPDEPILTVAKTRAAEQALIEGGVSVGDLMERAGEGAARWVHRVAAGRAVTVLAGPGNNGGDGYVIARRVREWGTDVAVVAPLEPATDAARDARARFGEPVLSDAQGRRGGVLVDCLFGSGLSRAIEGDALRALDGLRAAHDFLVAVDMPSGIDSDDGCLLNPTPAYDLTLALGAWKWAHVSMPAMATMGALELVDIGIETPATAAIRICPPRLAPPAPDAHKYSRGLLAIVGGAMPGAALLAAVAAQRAGAGYVKLLSGHSHPAAPADLVIDDRQLIDALADERIDAVLIGPGLGRDDVARDHLHRALDCPVPLVLDADALHLLDPDMLEGQDATRIVATPHEGELTRLCASFGIEGDHKRQRAERLAQATGMTVFAKGPDGFVFSADNAGAFPRGESWLATAGTGDVLAGIIASRLATGDTPFDAVSTAVWLQHEAARIAGSAATAGDMARAVNRAYAAFL